MLRPIWIASIHIRSFMRRYMPTNILLDRVRTRRGLKWGLALMLLAPIYFYIGSIFTTVAKQDNQGGLYLLALIAIWNAFKMLWIGPVTLVFLVRARNRERQQRRNDVAHPASAIDHLAEVHS